MSRSLCREQEYIEGLLGDHISNEYDGRLHKLKERLEDKRNLVEIKMTDLEKQVKHS